jgi:hypothetical protein
VSAPGVDLIVPRELVRATGRLAGAQIFVSASLPLNASVGAVAAKRLSGHEGLAGTSVGIAFLLYLLDQSLTSAQGLDHARNLRTAEPELAHFAHAALDAGVSHLTVRTVADGRDPHVLL